MMSVDNRNMYLVAECKQAASTKFFSVYCEYRKAECTLEQLFFCLMIFSCKLISFYSCQFWWVQADAVASLIFGCPFIIDGLFPVRFSWLWRVAKRKCGWYPPPMPLRTRRLVTAHGQRYLISAGNWPEFVSDVKDSLADQPGKCREFVDFLVDFHYRRSVMHASVVAFITTHRFPGLKLNPASFAESALLSKPWRSC